MAKELTWRGKTEAEMKDMDLKTFIQYVGARQRRSLQRGLSAQHKILLQKVNTEDKNIMTHCRDMVIVPAMLGKSIKVYNGKEFLPLVITLEMLGHYLGEFSLTRKSVTHSAAGIGATKSSRAISAR